VGVLVQADHIIKPLYSGQAPGFFFSIRVQRFLSPLRFLSNRHSGFPPQPNTGRIASYQLLIYGVYADVENSTLTPHTCLQLITLPHTGYFSGSHVGILIILFFFLISPDWKSEQAMQQDGVCQHNRLLFGKSGSGHAVLSWTQKCCREFSVFRTTHLPWLRRKKKCDKIALLWPQFPHNGRTEQFRRRLPQTLLWLAVRASQAKSNFTRNGKDNTKLEYIKLNSSVFWVIMQR
jgi:hypothetical protein